MHHHYRFDLSSRSRLTFRRLCNAPRCVGVECQLDRRLLNFITFPPYHHDLIMLANPPASLYTEGSWHTLDNNSTVHPSALGAGVNPLQTT